MEEKLGKGVLSGNIKEHEEFVPKLEALDEWCKKVQKGEVVYDGEIFLEMVDSFADTMVAHMTHVRFIFFIFLQFINKLSNLSYWYQLQEIQTLDRDIMREKFTIVELKAMDKEFMKRALASVDYYKTMPLSLVCGNPSTPWWVLLDFDELNYSHFKFRWPPIPAPLKWATRWWFARRYREAWEFGPLDFSGNERKWSFPSRTFCTMAVTRYMVRLESVYHGSLRSSIYLSVPKW